MKKFTPILAIAVMLLLCLAACSHLSPEAKKMVGNYYIPEISEETPLMELNKNGKCIVRAVKPDILTFWVEGRWNVVDDSLKITLNPESVKYEGDSSLIGSIPTTINREVVDFNDITLSLRDNQGISYLYHRRTKAK